MTPIPKTAAFPNPIHAATSSPLPLVTPSSVHFIPLPPGTLSPLPIYTSPSLPTPSPLPTIAPSPTPLRFAVIGDYGKAGAGEEAVANLVKSWQVAFIITTGDNNYPSGEATTIDQNIGQYYHEFIYLYTGIYGEGAEANRFFPSLGNHDWYTADAQPYLEYFTLPGNERYYDFTWGPVHFFALDSDYNEPDGIRVDSIQAGWLKSGLAASTSPWQLVYFHVAPYSSGFHGSAPVMQWPFAAWGADAVLSGHDHTYERLWVDEISYFVNGLGGNGRYAFLRSVAESQVRFNDEHGAMLIEATEQMMTFQFVTVTGEVVDTYTLERTLEDKE